MLILDVYPYPTWMAETLKPLSIFTIIFVLFSIIIVLGITSPLAELEKKAQKLGVGEKIKAVKLRGPIDIQNVIIAFNTMLKRVTNVNDHRARALAAISHDIRTPLTSMRLQAEFISEPDGNTVKIQYIRPDTDETLPCVYYIHGGGMEMSSCFDGIYKAWGRCIALQGVAVALSLIHI